MVDQMEPHLAGLTVVQLVYRWAHSWVLMWACRMAVQSAVVTAALWADRWVHQREYPTACLTVGRTVLPTEQL